jgi:FlaG/FlaF family flagellin (archaellin)
MKRAVSPIVSVVILIVISLSIASFIAPWMYELVLTTTNETGSSTQQQIRCRNAGLDFDSAYGNYGVQSNFSGNVSANQTDWIRARVVNTGNLDLYGFSFEVTLENQSVLEIKHYESTDATEMTASYPLRPFRSAIIEANITYDINESITTLKEVKVLNSVCAEVAPSLEL